MFAIETRRGSTQLKGGRILLGLQLERLDLLGGFTRTKYQHTRSQRVEGSRMSHLYSLNMKPLGEHIADMCQGSKARHPVRFVDIDKRAFLEIHRAS